ncbi:MAG: RsmD family RNA methyltransferase [Candidatus Omnitrophota bacterium]
MKIIAGIWKGIQLESPPSALARPTQERVKKAIFDILKSHVEGNRVLDLFSGSGALGLEALSRGSGRGNLR